jgi:hypothetical protein
MEAIQAPNWLSVVGSCYLIFAFGFLAGSAGFRRGWDTTPEIRSQITDYGRRVLTFAAGVTGLIGMLFHGLGQFVMVEHGTWFVLACMALVPIVLAYVFLGDHMLEAYRRTIESQPTSKPAATSELIANRPFEPVQPVTRPAVMASPPKAGHARSAAE